MNPASRISPSYAEASARISSASGTPTIPLTPSPASNIVVATTVRRDDSRERSKIFRTTPEEAIKQCKLRTTDINSKIKVQMSIEETSEANIIANQLDLIMPLLDQAERAYEDALKILRNVSGIVSAKGANSERREALVEFLSERDKARVLIRFYLGFRHSWMAQDIMRRVTETPEFDAGGNSTGKGFPHPSTDLRAQAFEHFGKAADILSQLKKDEFHTEQEFPGNNFFTPEQVLEATLTEEILHRENFINKSLTDIGINIKKLRQLAFGGRNKLRQERAALQNAPDPEPGNTAVNIKARMMENSQKVLAAIPQALAMCAALFEQNDALTQRLILEKEFFPESEQNRTSLLGTIMTSIWIHKGINDFQTLEFHEFLHYANESSSLSDQQFEHLNHIHGPVMKLCNFHHIMKDRMFAALGAERHDSIGAMLDVLASEFNTASEQLRFHSLAAISQESDSPEYRKAALLLNEFADRCFTISRQAYLAKDKLIEHELVSAHAGNSRTVSESREGLPDIDWSTAPPWLSEDSAGISLEGAKTTEASVISSKSEGKTRNKSKAAGPVIDQAMQDVQKLVEKLENKSFEFSKICTSASNDAELRLAQMRDGQLSDQHTWKTIDFLMKLACDNKRKELKCIKGAINRMAPLQNQPDIRIKIAELREKEKTLGIASSVLKRDAMRGTVEAITLKPTDQGMEYLKAENKIHSISQPTWVELTDPDDKYRNRKSINDYLIEYVITVKADAGAVNRKFVLHAHYNEPTPSYGAKPLKSHYKRLDQRGLGSASEIRLPDGSIFNPVYRNRDASIGLEIVHEMLTAEKRTPVQQTKTTKTKKR